MQRFPISTLRAYLISCSKDPLCCIHAALDELDDIGVGCSKSVCQANDASIFVAQNLALFLRPFYRWVN